MKHTILLLLLLSVPMSQTSGQEPATKSKIVGDHMLDAQMSEVAEFFAGKIKGDHDILFPEYLDRSKLDLSLDSLHSVDSWLEILHKKKITSANNHAVESIIWAGAYVGEVIRKNAKRNYHWVRYEDYMSKQKEDLRKVFPRTFGTQFILATGDSGMTLPLNKVVRFLEEGPENNLHFYASGDCQ